MIKNWYNRLSNPARAALATTFFTFMATVGIQLLGLLNEISGWVDGGNQPNWDTAVKVVISAAIAGATGLLNFVVRYFQAKSDPSSVPQYHNV